MDHIMQTGEVESMVNWSKEASCWSYTCAYGCFGYDFESEREATEAFICHRCDCAHEVPC